MIAGLSNLHSSKVVFIWKDFCLFWQERTATIHQINARKIILQGNFLGAQMLLDGNGKVGSAFDRLFS
jgi:hypothetical protein